MQKMHHFMRQVSDGRAGSLLRRRGFVATLLISGQAVLASALAQSEPIRVAAASDLKFALGELAQDYQRHSGVPVELNFGSSGQFAQQIRRGLPVDLYMAADESYVFQLADGQLTQDRGAVYATGRLALLVPASSSLVLDAGLRPVWEALPRLRHFAIANPQHAPYGRAARQVLERLGWWERIQSKLVLGENIAQATQYVSSGAADAGITALSLAIAPEVARLTRSLALPAELHAPLRQRMVLLRSATVAAAGFYQYLLSRPARELLLRRGFGAAS
jgi:molybdate transport system substrate-binding protein